MAVVSVEILQFQTAPREALIAIAAKGVGLVKPIICRMFC